MKTFDKKEVKVGSKVWVIGSCGDIHPTKVLPPVTDYHLFGPIPVSQSFSTKKAAAAHLEKARS